MRIGLDYHGVIDAYPKFFSEFSKVLKKNGHDVFIITGSSVNSSLKQELAACNILYTDIFSLIDYHTSLRTPVEKIDEKGNPWFNSLIWNSTKAEYCKKENISLHIDDSEEYKKHFQTPFCLFDKFWCYFEWEWKNKKGFFMLTEPESVYSLVTKIIQNIDKEG